MVWGLFKQCADQYGFFCRINSQLKYFCNILGTQKPAYKYSVHWWHTPLASARIPYQEIPGTESRAFALQSTRFPTLQLLPQTVNSNISLEFKTFSKTDQTEAFWHRFLTIILTSWLYVRLLTSGELSGEEIFCKYTKN